MHVNVKFENEKPSSWTSALTAVVQSAQLVQVLVWRPIAWEAVIGHLTCEIQTGNSRVFRTEGVREEAFQ